MTARAGQAFLSACLLVENLLARRLWPASRLPQVTLAARNNGYLKPSCHFSVLETVFVLRVCSRSVLLSPLIVVNSNLSRT